MPRTGLCSPALLILVGLSSSGPWIATGQAADATPVEVPVRDRPVEFETDIAPILRRNCVACHRQKESHGGLNLETAASILTGGDHGPAVRAGNAVESLLLKVAARQQDPVMPPPENTVGARPLTPGELGLLKLWVDQGASAGTLRPHDIRWHDPSPAHQPAFAVAVTPDGQYVACSRGSHLDLIHLPTGVRETTLSDPELPDLKSGPRAHRDFVRSLAFDPSGDLLASGGYREVKLWRRPRLRSRAQQTHPSTAQVAAVHASRIATGTVSGTVLVWDRSRPEEPRTLAAHSAAVTALAWSPDGTRLYSASLDKTLRCWDVTSGVAVGAAVELPAAARTLCTVERGAWLAVGLDEGGIRIWDRQALETTTETVPALHVFHAHDGSVVALEADSSERGLLSGGSDGRIRRWQPPFEKPVQEWGVDGQVVALSLSPDGQTVAVATSKQVEIWSRQGTRTAAWHEDPTRRRTLLQRESDVTFARAALEMARQDLKNYEGLIRIAKVRAKDVEKAEAELVKVRKTRDEKQAALEKVKAENGKIEPAEKALAEAETAVTVAGTVIERAKAVAERTARALADAEQAVVRRDEGLKELETLQKAAADDLRSTPLVARTIAFRGDGRQIWIGNASGEIHAYHPTGVWLETVARHPNSILKLTQVGEDQLISVSADQTWEWQTPRHWTLERVIGHGRGDGESGSTDGPLSDRVLSLDFSPDGNQLATAGGVPSHSGELRIWRVADGRLERDIRDVHPDTVFAVRFSPTGDRLATACNDRFVRIFEANSGTLLRQLAGHTGAVLSLGWSGDGQSLVTAGADQVLKLWDVNSGTPVRTMKGTTYRIGPYRRDVTSVTFVGKSEQILAASGDGTVRLHRTPSENDILTFAGSEGYQLAVAATPDGRVVVSSGSDGTVRIWSGHQQQPRQVFRRGEPLPGKATGP